MLIFCIQSDIQGNYKLIMSFWLGVHIFYGRGDDDHRSTHTHTHAVSP